MRSPKIQVGDYVEVIEENGGGVKVGAQGIVIDDNGLGFAYGVLFPTIHYWDSDDGSPWLCTTRHLKRIYRPRLNKEGR